MGELDGQQGKRQTLVDLEIMRFFVQFWRRNRPVNYLIDEQKHREKGKYATVYAVSDYISAHFRRRSRWNGWRRNFMSAKAI